MFSRAKGFLVAALMLLVVFFRGRSKLNKAEAEAEADRADRAQGAADLSQKIDQNLSEVEHKQREEQLDAENRFDAGDRDHLNNKW